MKIFILGIWNEKTRHKVAPARFAAGGKEHLPAKSWQAGRRKGRIEDSVPLCSDASMRSPTESSDLCAPMLRYGVRQNRRTSVPDEKGFTPLEINSKKILVSNKTARANEKIRMSPISYGNVKKHFLSLKGFTLLELSLVILLIGMVLSLVLPNVGIHKSKLEKEREIEKISQAIKSLYDLSQVQNKEITLLFDLDENKFYAISFTDGEEEYLLPEKRLSSALKIKDIVNFEGDKTTEGIASLIFNPDGFVNPATIHFVDKDFKFYTLFINPLTGQSRTCDGYLEVE